MSATTLDDVVKKTADILGRIIKKPPLTPKLLSKPPFRYLHDLISEVLTTSDFAAGLYSADEMNSENVKEKEAKIAYLTKIIDCVGISTGVEIKCNPLKIVAGMEPEETNFLLQLLGKAVLKKVDSVDAVKRVLAGEHQQAGKSSKGGSEKRSGKSSTAGSANDLRKTRSELSVDPPAPAPPFSAKKAREREPSAEVRPPATSAAPEPEAELPPPPQPPAQRATKEYKELEVERTSTPVASPTPAPPAPPAPQPTREPARDTSPLPPPPAIQKQSAPPPDSRSDAGKPPPAPALSSALAPAPDTPAPSSQAEAEEPSRGAPADAEERAARAAAGAVSSAPRRMRPASARPAPPRQRAPEVAVEEIPKNVPIIFQDDKRDDEEDFVVITHDTDGPESATIGDDSGPLADEKHGGLVRTILQTKQELESGKTEDAKSKAKSGKEALGGKKEIEALREWIQALTRSTNPLGKTMDYMQEDVDSMNRELEMWRVEHQKYKNMLDEELRITKEEAIPFDLQLKSVEAAIEEQLDKISTAKASIIQNETMVQTLLRGITKGG
ncbi:TRAF3-interacting protein 1 [Geranomyces michiganensis]|nr:TRAF3-interacting protein 1 [Geranomyces michiganensis]